MSLGKKALRVEALTRRRLLTPEQRAASEAALLEAVGGAARDAGGGRIAAYVSVGHEPGTRSVLAEVDDLLLPVLLPDGDLEWAAYDGTLVPRPHGLLEPTGPRLGRDALADCAVVVVPALAVSLDGVRLGRGGGSYDRALPRARGLVVAALHEGELVSRLPSEPHDRPVHAAVVPGRGLVLLPRDPSGGMGP